MILHFPTRSKARAYASLNGKQPIDNGPNSAPGKRWACEAVIVVISASVPNVPRETKQPRNMLRKKTIVIINADKETPDSSIEQCFGEALANWKAGKPKQDDRMNRHTARAELNALFK